MTSRLDAVANQPKTPLQNFRMDEDVWKAFIAKAVSEGTNASAKIREFVLDDLGRPSEDDGT